MTHNKIMMLFIKYYQAQNPDSKIFKNSTGYASKEHVHYGIPADGGGFDLFVFKPGGITVFFEIKTIAYPTLSKKQKKFASNMRKLNFECFVVKEITEDPFFYVIPAHLYRPCKKWPY